MSAVALKLVILSTYDVRSPLPWSGIPHFLSRAFATLCTQTVIVSPHHPRETTATIAKAVHYRNRGLAYDPDRDIALLKERAVRINQILKTHSDADAIVVYHPPDAAHIDTRVPIVIIHDAPWNALCASYPGFARHRLCDETYNDSLTCETAAFQIASRIIWFSDWAYTAAQRQYPDLSHKMHVVLPGANLSSDTIPASASLTSLIRRRLSGNINVLTIGVDPDRKGAELFIRTINAVNRDGLSCLGHIVGPNVQAHTANLVCHGFLRKDDPIHLQKLLTCFQDAAILIHPAIAECAGIVACEAAAFGIPVIAARVGGLPSIVVDGVTGRLVDRRSHDSYGHSLREFLSTPASYRLAAEASVERYRADLNWSTHARKVLALLDTN